MAQSAGKDFRDGAAVTIDQGGRMGKNVLIDKMNASC